MKKRKNEYHHIAFNYTPIREEKILHFLFLIYTYETFCLNMFNETFLILLNSLLTCYRSTRYLYFYFIYSFFFYWKKKFIMLLHNNTIANAAFVSAAESPPPTTNVFSHPNPQATSANQFFQNFSPPWIQQYNNQRLLTEQFFVCILFWIYSCSNIHSYRS